MKIMIHFLVSLCLFIETAFAAELQHTKSSFEACQKINLIKKDDYDQNKAYWDDVIKASCNKGSTEEQFQIIPSNGLFITDIANGSSSLEFLLKVGNELNQILEKNIAEIETVKKCIEFVTTKDTHCTEIVSSLQKSIKEGQMHSRLALAVIGGKSPEIKNGQFVIPKKDELIAKTLGDGVSDSLLPNEITPLTPTEKKAVQEVVYEIASHIQVKVQNKEISPEEGIREFEKFREMQRNNYVDTLEKAPILAYLGQTELEGEPARQSLLRATNELLSNAKSQKENVKKLLEDKNNNVYRPVVNANPDATDAVPLTEFIKYTPVVEKILRENQSYCSTAQNLSDYAEYAKWRKNGAVLAGALSASVLASVLFPPTLTVFGVAISGATAGATLFGGPPIAAAYIWDEFNHYKKTNSAFHSALETNDTTPPLMSAKQVQDQKENLEWAVALSPLALIGTGAPTALADFGKRFMLYSAIKNGKNVPGYNNSKLRDLLKLADSKNKSVATDTKNELQKVADDFFKSKIPLTDKSLNGQIDDLAQTLASKNLLGTVDRPDPVILEELTRVGLNYKGNKNEFLGNINQLLKHVDDPKAFADKRPNEIINELIAFGKMSSESPQAAQEMFRILALKDKEQIATILLEKLNQLPKEIQNQALKQLRMATPAGRLQVAEELLGKTLTEKQKEAILKAHYYGKLGADGKYSQIDNMRKGFILRRAGFDDKQTKILMDNNVTGVIDDFASILDDVVSAPVNGMMALGEQAKRDALAREKEIIRRAGLTPEQRAIEDKDNLLFWSSMGVMVSPVFFIMLSGAMAMLRESCVRRCEKQYGIEYLYVKNSPIMKCIETCDE